jgi:hypothetical protein
VILEKHEPSVFLSKHKGPVQSAYHKLHIPINQQRVYVFNDIHSNFERDRNHERHEQEEPKWDDDVVNGLNGVVGNVPVKEKRRENA